MRHSSVKKGLVSCVLVLLLLGGLYAGGAKETTSVKSDDSKIHVALIVKNLSNPFFVSMKQGGQAAANKYGVEYTCLSPEQDGNVEGQIRIMEDLIQRGIDAIVVVPIDSQGIVAGIERANAAGVPVFVANTKAMGGKIIGYAGIDNIRLSEMMGKYIVDRFNGNAQIVLLEGVAGSQSSIDRKIGFMNVFSKEPGIKILTSTPGDFIKTKGMQVTEDLLVRFDKIDAIISFNDSMALGAVEALKAAGRLHETVVTGNDANTDALDSIRKGELTATADNDPFGQAFVSVESTIRYLMYGEIPPEENLIVSGGTINIVDKSNIEQFKENASERLAQYGVSE